RDRAHSGQREAAGHPAWGAGGGIDAAHLHGHEAGAARAPAQGGLVPQLDRDTAAAAPGDLDAADRIGVVGAGGMGVLAGHAAHGEAVAAVGGHVDLDDLIGQPQQLDGIVAGLGAQTRAVTAAEHDDAVHPVGVRTQAQLLAAADHAVRGVAVGLPSGDREVAGQHGAGQGDHHQVPGLEVVGTADHAAAGPLRPGLGVRGIVGVLIVLGADVHAHPVDGLAV